MYREVWIFVCMLFMYVRMYVYIGNPANPSKRPNIVGYNRLPQLTTGLNSGPTSLPSSSMVLNQNPYKLEKGSVVQYDHPPKYGVVKWIGIIPGRTTLYAGVEMVNHSINI